MTIEIQIVSNASVSKILTPNREVQMILSELLSYFVLGHEKTFSFKNERWDGKSTMFDWTTMTFPSGFMEIVKQKLSEEGFKIIHLQKDLPKPLGVVPKTLGGFSYTARYDYQWENLQQLEKRGGMISHLATGAGKTFAAALAITRIDRPTLILTKRQPLMYQFVERLEKFGISSGLIGDTKFDLQSQLTTAMVQTLNRRITEGDKTVLEYLKTIEFIIGEEAHEVSDENYWNVIRHCPNAYYKMGLTATPFMRVNSEANMKLLGAFGPLGISIDEKTLIDRGILAKPVIKFASYERPDKLKYGSNYLKAVEAGISTASSRNALIGSEAAKASKKGLAVLILVQRKEHGKTLVPLLEKLGLKVEYIFGESNQKLRKKALNKLGTGEINVLIGSSIVDVGIDVPAIGLVIMAGGGKAEVAYRQRIGRGLREKTVGPNLCFILDFIDSHNQYLHDHYRERLGIIKATPGFVDCLINEEDDFPYELF